NYLCLSFVCLLLSSTLSEAQNYSELFTNTDTVDKETIATVKFDRYPTRLMVIPDLPTYRQIKTVVEKDANYKLAINMIAQTLEERGFVVKDFLEALRVSEEKYKSEPEIGADLMKIMLENAAADIFIYVDLCAHTEDNGKYVSIMLRAVDKYTADRYVSSPYLRSTKRHWNNFQSALTEALNIDNGLHKFLLKLERKLFLAVELGRKIDLQIQFINPEKLSFDHSNIQLGALTDRFCSWIRRKSNFSYEVGVYERMLRMEVNIPFMDKYNQVYTPVQFGTDLQDFARNLLKGYNVNGNSIKLEVIGSRILLMIQ
ncbi:MAG: DUF6175 family protein, partial [Bacteroidota bacterium]